MPKQLTVTIHVDPAAAARAGKTSVGEHQLVLVDQDLTELSADERDWLALHLSRYCDPRLGGSRDVIQWGHALTDGADPVPDASIATLRALLRRRHEKIEEQAAAKAARLAKSDAAWATQIDAALADREPRTVRVDLETGSQSDRGWCLTVDGPHEVGYPPGYHKASFGISAPHATELRARIAGANAELLARRRAQIAAQLPAARAAAAEDRAAREAAASELAARQREIIAAVDPSLLPALDAGLLLCADRDRCLRDHLFDTILVAEPADRTWRAELRQTPTGAQLAELARLKAAAPEGIEVELTGTSTYVSDPDHEDADRDGDIKVYGVGARIEGEYLGLSIAEIVVL